MNPLSLNVINVTLKFSKFCKELNVLYVKFEDTEKQVRLATVTNARIIEKQRSSIRIVLLMSLCVF
jgi:hypothetical protein